MGVRTWLRRRRWEHEMDAEFKFHLESHIDDLVARGVPGHEAEQRARHAFGAVTLAKDECRDVRGVTIFHDAVQDVRYAGRTLARNPGFATVAVLTLALGIGANTAIFSVVNAVLLRPLALPDADRWVTIIENKPETEPFDGRPARRPPVADVIRDMESQARSLSEVYLYSDAPDIRIPGREEEPALHGATLSGSAMVALGGRPILGRLLDERESAPAVVLSAETWRRRFGGDPAIIGRTLSADIGNLPTMRTTRTYTVVGVLAPGFSFPRANLDYWTQGGRAPNALNIARLTDGTSLEAAQAEVEAVLHRVTNTPVPRAAERSGPRRFELVPLHEHLVGRVRPTLHVFFLIVSLVLLIAAANVANLVLARATTRQREVAVRAVLGASRGRLIRQMLAETVVLSGLGGVVGTLVAVGGIRLMRNLLASFEPGTLVRQVGALTGPATFPRLEEIRLDATTLAFTAGVCLVTGVLFGLAPALRYTGRLGLDIARDGTLSAVPGFGLGRRNAPRSALVITQVALATTLLVGGGLLVNSLVNLLSTNKGFDPSNVLTFQVESRGRRGSVQDLRRFAEELVQRLTVIPGVRHAGYAHGLPLIMREQNTGMRLTPGERLPEWSGPGADPLYYPDLRLVSRDFLEATGTRIVAGRGLNPVDDERSARVLLVNETLARSRFPRRNPVGQQVYLTIGSGLDAEPWEIVGIVEDVRQQGLDIDPRPQMFGDLAQWPRFHEAFDVPQYFAVRTHADPLAVVAQIRGAVQDLDPGARLNQVHEMNDLVSSALARPRVYAILLAIFSGVGLALATIGVYGVMAYSVAQSTRELGIRLALGARRDEILTLVLGRAGLLAGVGIALGLLGALAVTRSLQGMLFGLTPTDPMTFLAAAVLFGSVAMVASYVPARRATRIDPMVALRYE